ncbi:hypothetical protein HRbin11_02156 [bacterium HR11]|nr:hypothetical protein HRbin11_02156 [bacterium HR11]
MTDDLALEVDALMELGDLASARTRAAAWRPEGADAATCARWGERFERLGMVREALQAYHHAVRQSSRPEWHARLAELYLDLGKWSTAEEHLQTAVEAGATDPRVFLRLGEILEEREALDAARQVYQTGLERTQAPELRARLKRLPALPTAPDAVFGRRPGEAEVALLAQYFQGREGVYARQWVDRQGRVGYQPVHEPLTLRVIRQHLDGDLTCGVYPVRLDGTVFFAVWDVDINRNVLEKYLRRPDRLAELARLAHETAVRIAARSRTLGLPGLIEDSGFKGRHVWVFFNAPVEARIVRAVAERIARLDPIPSGLHVDVFPRQDTVEPGQLGNLIKLPLGIHRRTGRRCLFLDPDGRALPDPFRALAETPRLPPEALLQAAEQLTALPPAPQPVSTEEREARELQAALTPPYSPEADPEFQTVVTCCPVLGALVQKARTEHMLTYDEQLVLVHTLGYLTHGVEVVNAVLGTCVNVYPQLLLKSPLRGNPMSCPKIRQRIPDVTRRIPCRCPEQTDLGYPTPVLFLRLRASTPADAWERVELQAMAEALLRMEQERRRLEAQMEDLRQRLSDRMRHHGQDVIETPYGRVRRTQASDGTERLTVEV